MSAGFTNIASVTANPVIGGGAIGPVSDPTVVVVTQPTIVIDKDDADNTDDTQAVAINGTATFTIKVTAPATNLVPLDTVEIVDAVANSVSCNRSTAQTAAEFAGGATTGFDPGETFSYTCVTTALTVGFVNTATVTANPVGSATPVTPDSDTTVVTVFDPSKDQRLIIDKDDNDNFGDNRDHNDSQTILAGGDVAFTIFVLNNSPAAINLTEIVDAEAPNCNRSGAALNALVQGALMSGNPGNGDTTLDSGESFSYTCDRTNVQVGQFIQEAGDTTTDNDIIVNGVTTPGGTPVTDNDESDVIIETPGLTIIKNNRDNQDAVEQFINGGTAIFTIKVENTGTTDLSNVSVSDPEASTLDPSCALTAPEVQAILANNATDPADITVLSRNTDADAASIFAPGEFFEYRCNVAGVTSLTFLNEDNTVVDNDATATATVVLGGATLIVTDPNPVTFLNASIQIIKADADTVIDDSQTVSSGGTATFNITVTNNGFAPLKDLIITDLDIAAGLTDCHRDVSETNALLALNALGTEFDPNETFTYQCTVANVNDTTFDGSTTVDANDIEVVATVVGETTTVRDEDPSTVVIDTPALTVQKNDADNSDDKQVVIVGGTARFTITVTNSSTIGFERFEITDLDPIASACSLNTNQVDYILFGGATTGAVNPVPQIVSFVSPTGATAGNTILEPGETFSYVCEAPNVQTNSFSDNDNDVSVFAHPVDGGSPLTIQDNTTVVVPLLVIDKNDADNTDDTQEVSEGGTATFTITLTNNGTADLRDIAVADAEAPDCAISAAVFSDILQGNPLPGSITLVTPPTDLTNAIFEPGQTLAYTCGVGSVTAQGATPTFPDGDNDITVTGVVDADGSALTPLTEFSFVTIVNSGIDVQKSALDGTDTQTVVNGESAAFRITVTNTGGQDLTGVTVDDLDLVETCDLNATEVATILTTEVVPAGRTDIQTVAKTGNGDNVLNPNESFVYTCRVENVGLLTFDNGNNEVKATGTLPDATQITDTDPTNIVFVNGSIEIVKDDSTPVIADPLDADGDDSQNVELNKTATFTIKVTNNGTTDLTNVVVIDVEAPSCELTAGNVIGIIHTNTPAHIDAVTNTVITGATATVTNGDEIFNVGESFTYQCTVEDVTATTFTNNENSATASAVTVQGTKSVSDTDTSAVVVISNLVGEIEITKSSDPVTGTQVAKNSTITYTLRVENKGQLDLTGVTVTDQLDTNLTYGTSANTAVSHAAGTVTINVGDLAVGGVQSYSFTVTVNIEATGIINNEARVEGQDTNSNTVSDTSNIVTHTLPGNPNGGGSGGGGSAPVITAVDVCSVNGRGDVITSSVRPDRRSDGWQNYLACKSDPGNSEAECAYAWAVSGGYNVLGAGSNNCIEEPIFVEPISPTPIVPSTPMACAYVDACPGCFKTTEPVITKSILDNQGQPQDKVAIAKGEVATYEIKIDLGQIEDTANYQLNWEAGNNNHIRVYDYTIPAESGSIWYKTGVDSIYAQDGWYYENEGVPAGGVYFEKGLTKADYDAGFVTLRYEMNTDLAFNKDAAQLVNNAFALVHYDYKQRITSTVAGVTTYTWRSGDPIEVPVGGFCDDSHVVQLTDLAKEDSTYGDKATLALVRPFVGTQGGDAGIDADDQVERVTGDEATIREEIAEIQGDLIGADTEVSGRVVVVDNSLYEDAGSTLQPTSNFSQANTVEEYYQYLIDSVDSDHYLDPTEAIGGDNTGVLIADKGYIFDKKIYNLDKPTTIIVTGGHVEVRDNIEIQGNAFLAVIVYNADGESNIIFSDTVTEVQGAFISETGKIIEIGTGKEEQLVIDGMIVGDMSQLLEQRKYIGTSIDDIQPNVEIRMDIRLLDATPPGLEQALGSDWGQIE